MNALALIQKNAREGKTLSATGRRRLENAQTFGAVVGLIGGVLAALLGALFTVASWLDANEGARQSLSTFGTTLLILTIVYYVARQKPSGKGEMMPTSIHTTSSRHMAHRWGNFGLEIRKRLAKAFERLGCAVSAIIIKRMARRELQYREGQRCKLGYEARKRELLVALRHKISEKHTKNTTLEG